MTTTASNQPPRSSWLRRLAGPPEYTAEDKAQTGKNLNILLPVAAVLLGIRVLFAFFEQGFQLSGFEFAIIVLILLLGGLWAMARRGYVLAAATLLILLSFVSMVFIALQANKLFDGAFAALFMVIVMAGVLLGWKAVVVVVAMSIAAAWWLASQSAGSEIVLTSNTPPEYARDVSIIFSLTAVLIILLIGNLRQALARSRANEQVMREQNMELTAMRTQLEERVTERTEQLRTAADVGRVASSILDTQQLMNEVVNLITTRFGFYYAAVFTLNQDGSYLILQEATGEAGRILKERGHQLRVGLDSMVGYTVMKREPRVAVNAGDDAMRFANPLLPDTQSEIALPLLVGDQVLGALDVQSTQPNAFDESAIATLQNVAAQIAIALQNAQSYQRLQQALSFTTHQYELSRTIVTARTPQEAYQSLGQVFAMMSGIDRIAMLRITDRDTAGQPVEYELAISWDTLGGAQFDTGQRYVVAETPLAGLVTEDEVIVIRDAQDSRLPLETRRQLAQVGAQAVMLVPVNIHDRFDGFISAIAEQPHDFQDSEVRLVKSAAEQLGVVLSNLQLATEMQTTLERVALLNRRLSNEAWSGYLGNRESWLVESGHASRVAATSELSIPITVRGETIGTFNVADADADREWQEEDLTMLQTIAGEVALAIENARLIEQTQRAAQREKAVAEAADKIHRSMDIETVLQSAVTELQRITGRRGISVQLGFGSTNVAPGRATVSRGEATARANGNGQAAGPEGDQANA